MNQTNDQNVVEEIATQTKISLEKAADKLGSWVDAFIGHLPNMAVALLVIILFAFLARIGKRWVDKLFDPQKNDVIKNLSTHLVYYTIFGLGLFIVLEILGLRTTVTSLLAGVGIVGIALGFAFQDIAANFLSGIILAYRKPFQVFDICQMGEHMGSVTQINIRDTVIKTFQGQEIVIPNRSVIQNPIINYTSLGERRIDLAFRVSFQEDLALVKSITETALTGLSFIVPAKEIHFIYTDFEHSAIGFEIRFWVKYEKENDYIDAKTQAIIAIKNALEKQHISVPFTTRINKTMSLE